MPVPPAPFEFLGLPDPESGPSTPVYWETGEISPTFSIPGLSPRLMDATVNFEDFRAAYAHILQDVEPIIHGVRSGEVPDFGIKSEDTIPERVDARHNIMVKLAKYLNSAPNYDIIIDPRYDAAIKEILHKCVVVPFLYPPSEDERASSSEEEKTARLTCRLQMLLEETGMLNDLKPITRHGFDITPRDFLLLLLQKDDERNIANDPYVLRLFKAPELLTHEPVKINPPDMTNDAAGKRNLCWYYISLAVWSSGILLLTQQQGDGMANGLYSHKYIILPSEESDGTVQLVRGLSNTPQAFPEVIHRKECPALMYATGARFTLEQLAFIISTCPYASMVINTDMKMASKKTRRDIWSETNRTWIISQFREYWNSIDQTDADQDQYQREADPVEDAIQIAHHVLRYAGQRRTARLSFSTLLMECFGLFTEAAGDGRFSLAKSHSPAAHVGEFLNHILTTTNLVSTLEQGFQALVFLEANLLPID